MGKKKDLDKTAEQSCDQELETTQAAQEEEAQEAAAETPATPEEEGLKAALECAQKDLEKAKEEAESYKDKYLRSVAEFDNFKRRTIKEKEALSADVKAVVVGGLLPILDNLEIAIKQAEEGAVKDGLVMLLQKSTDTLKGMGVEEIESENATFDPAFHNAVMHVEQEGVDDNTIVEVFQRGYKLGDKIIRHAMVKVAN